MAPFAAQVDRGRAGCPSLPRFADEKAVQAAPSSLHGDGIHAARTSHGLLLHHERGTSSLGSHVGVWLPAVRRCLAPSSCRHDIRRPPEPGTDITRPRPATRTRHHRRRPPLTLAVPVDQPGRRFDHPGRGERPVSPRRSRGMCRRRRPAVHWRLSATPPTCTTSSRGSGSDLRGKCPWSPNNPGRARARDRRRRAPNVQDRPCVGDRTTHRGSPPSVMPPYGRRRR
jgi:hypothetical protein